MKSTYQCQGQELQSLPHSLPQLLWSYVASLSASFQFVGRQHWEQPPSACPLLPDLAAGVETAFRAPVFDRVRHSFLTSMSSEDTWKLGRSQGSFSTPSISILEPVARIRRLLVLKGIGAQINM